MDGMGTNICHQVLSVVHVPLRAVTSKGLLLNGKFDVDPEPYSVDSSSLRPPPGDLTSRRLPSVRVIIKTSHRSDTTDSLSTL